MDMFLIIALFMILAISTKPAQAYQIPQPNNKFGIHILFPEEIEKAAKLVNSNGDWGYVTIPIQSYDRDLAKWQNFMDSCKKYHLIPIIRLATYPEGNTWAKPTLFDTLDWPNFLDSLEWPTKDRLVILYNETNHSQEWGGEISPEDYATHINDIIDQFKKRSQDFVLLNGAQDLSAPNSSVTIDEFTYFRRMNNAVPGIFKKFDGWASHSYPQPAFSGRPEDVGRKSIVGYKEELAFLDREFGIKNLPVFITETGWEDNSIPKYMIGEFYKKAFTEVWTEQNIIAVTPFLLSAGSGGFEGFSFLSPSGEEQDSYKAIASLPKLKGNPTLNSTPVVLGEQKTNEALITPLPTSKTSVVSLEKIKDFVSWAAHLKFFNSN